MFESKVTPIKSIVCVGAKVDFSAFTFYFSAFTPTIVGIRLGTELPHVLPGMTFSQPVSLLGIGTLMCPDDAATTDKSFVKTC